MVARILIHNELFSTILGCSRDTFSSLVFLRYFKDFEADP